ncbi:MAG: type II toxin-antitoxin system VapC family toxin [Phycisphaeraceae bacterium]|nr:type II toxin-antitoxin system VapC family toxin [Phycisphaeraceae bacterium]MBX3366738.1 type II toxin-antitoxin system VapC family toxin [Phycisphaeraceae bacterium]
MKPTVYLETSVVSYVAARPSRDIVVAAQQQLTHEWWNTRRSDFELVISDVVSDEASAGDPDAAARRLKFLSGLRVLRPTDADASLAQALVARLSLPRRAAIDALHIAIAAANNVQYLLTWNCSHIANAVHRPGIQSVCVESGLSPPLICTPQELM